MAKPTRPAAMKSRRAKPSSPDFTAACSRPVGHRRSPWASARRLIVVPHGVLHYLPFHALIDPSGTPLVERVDIAYAPSATVLASCYERPSIPEGLGQRLLVGVPDKAIPLVAGEIEALAGSFGSSTVLFGQAATG